MILLLTGEGDGDIGTCAESKHVCEGAAFIPGPMALFIDVLVAPIWHYSPLDASGFVFVSESELSRLCRQPSKSMNLPGKKRGFETAYFFKNARVLARHAKHYAQEKQCPVGAVFFRDSDGTRSSPKCERQDKVKSINDGFSSEGFDFGVAMVPKPKSEAWLLCAVQEAPYQKCERFEFLSGNDCSSNSPKQLLNKALDDRNRRFPDLCDMIKKGMINPSRICMPSFSEFRCRLEKVAREMLHAETADLSPKPTSQFSS